MGRPHQSFGNSQTFKSKPDFLLFSQSTTAFLSQFKHHDNVYYMLSRSIWPKRDTDHAIARPQSEHEYNTEELKKHSVESIKHANHSHHNIMLAKQYQNEKAT